MNIRSSILLCLSAILLVAATNSYAEGYQELTPTAVYSGVNGQLYIVMDSNIGANECSLNKNSVLIDPSQQSDEMAKSALAVALSAIATKQNVNVYWSGCLSNGRPKATLVGLGTTEIN